WQYGWGGAAVHAGTCLLPDESNRLVNIAVGWYCPHHITYEEGRSMLRQAHKRLSMWLILLVVTSVSSVVVVLLSAAPAPSAPTITWPPAAVTVPLTPGVSTTQVVSFTSSQTLTYVTVRVVPALAPLVQVAPASLSSITKGQPTALTLAMAVPA